VLQASTPAELAIARETIKKKTELGDTERRISPLRLIGGDRSNEEQSTPTPSGADKGAGISRDSRVNTTQIPMLIRGNQEASKQVNAIRRRLGPRSRTRIRPRRLFAEDSDDTEEHTSQPSSKRETDRSRQRKLLDQPTALEKDTATLPNTGPEDDKRGKRKEEKKENDNDQISSNDNLTTPFPPKRAKEGKEAQASGKSYDTGRYRNLAEAKGLANEEIKRALELANEEKWMRLAPEEVIRRSDINPEEITA